MSDLMDDINKAIKANCDHVCHKRGLNPWIKECPTCGCANPKYDPEAVSDIDMSEFERGDVLGLIGLISGRRRINNE